VLEGGEPFLHRDTDTPAKPNHLLIFTQKCLPNQTIAHIYAETPAKPYNFPPFSLSNQPLPYIYTDEPAKQNHFFTFAQISLPNQTISSHLHSKHICQAIQFSSYLAKPNHFPKFIQIRLPNQTISSHLHRSACQTKPFHHI
jgi:hypothetical protein